mmetsp:Transcript_19709/g.45892  ORF Transcript_19709/g.45892 Transcript_19709/m.45892 type:complete len:99 (+) Transcript_19709:1401-1697(+)
MPLSMENGKESSKGTPGTDWLLLNPSNQVRGPDAYFLQGRRLLSGFPLWRRELWKAANAWPSKWTTQSPLSVDSNGNQQNASFLRFLSGYVIRIRYAS